MIREVHHGNVCFLLISQIIKTWFQALVQNRGNIWTSVTECVEERRRKFAQLMIAGKGHWLGRDIVAALTKYDGDVDKALLQLSRLAEQQRDERPAEAQPQLLLMNLEKNGTKANDF